MTGRRWTACAALLAACLATGVVATPAAAADPGAAPSLSAPSSRSATQLVQHVTVRWTGTQRTQVFSKDAVIPGIGDLSLVCRSTSTMLRLHTEDRQRETQMWLQKYEVKNGHDVVAVKVPRIYRYAHALDAGRGGTGYYAHEGLNKTTPIENYSRGTINGLISQRPGRHLPGTAFAPPPVTSFELTWYWNGFRHPAKYRSCTIDAVFTTRLDTRMGLTWHGSADAVGHETQRSRVPGIGYLTVTCRDETDPTGAAQTVSIEPDDPDADLYVERVTGEGRVEDQVATQGYGYGALEPGVLGPVTLPRNGTLRMRIRVGGADRWVLVSSYAITNNPDPRLNLCEVAAAHYAR